MPLVAFLDGERIESYLATDEHWDLVKSEYKSRSLLMRCGVPGIPRTSRRGLKHFAHKAGVQCGLIDCWNESPQHRMIKTLIAQALRVRLERYQGLIASPFNRVGREPGIQ